MSSEDNHNDNVIDVYISDKTQNGEDETSIDVDSVKWVKING